MSGRPRLLFVDDEPRVLNAMRAVFKSGYDVTLAAGAAQALEEMRLRHFDVIVSDQRMPGMSGVEFLRLVRKLSPTTVRILLTGYSDAEAVVAAVNDVEVDRFMKKPWDNATLKRMVGEAVDIAVTLRAADAARRGLVVRHGVPPVSARHGKDRLVVVDPEPLVHAQIEAEFSGLYEVLHAPSLLHCLALMEQRPCSVIICAIDTESQANRVFLMQLKQEHPQVIVITLSEGVDSQRMIELINNARVFRVLRRTSGFQALIRALYAAFDLVRRHRAEPLLLRRQAAEPPPDDLTRDPAARDVALRLRRIGRPPPDK
jgi:DNA-binding NtrC family response regulator